MCQKKSILYKASDIKLFIPPSKEAGSIVPTSSTTAQLALGDAIAIATMNYKNLARWTLRITSIWSLGAQLKTVEDIMLSGNKIPFINESVKMSEQLIY